MTIRPDFTEDLLSGTGQVSQSMGRISTDSDADTSPKKNAADINEIAMAVEFLVKALEELARQHAIMKLKIAKLAGEDIGMEGMGGGMGGETVPVPEPEV